MKNMKHQKYIGIVGSLLAGAMLLTGCGIGGGNVQPTNTPDANLTEPSPTPTIHPPVDEPTPTPVPTSAPTFTPYFTPDPDDMTFEED